MTADPLAFARRLIDHGVGIFLARPMPEGWTGNHANGFILPSGWQRTRTRADALDLYRHGMAVCAVGGGPLSVLDVDPRNGGTDTMHAVKAAGLWPREYAITDTPGGGTHHFIANLGIPKTKRDGIDYQGGLGDESAGFVFLPPTVRPALPAKCGGPYILAVDSLDTFGMDDPSGAAMRDWLAAGNAPATGTVDGARSFDLGDGHDPILEIGAEIPTGEHQGVLFRYACSLRARGVREPEAERLVNLRAAQDCKPAWRGPDDAWSCVRHAYKYEEGAPRAGARELTEPASVGAASAAGRRLVVRSAADIEMQVSDWLWRHDLGAQHLRGARYEHWVPLGGLTLLGGREGTGKSSWTARLCAQVTNGKMEGIYEGRPKGVLLAATEDDWGTTIVPRLAAAGADLTRVYRADVQLADDVMTGLTLPADVAAVRRVVTEHDVALIVLDPLMSVVDGALDTHKDADVRRALEPIVRLASETDAAILGLIHQNKAAGGDFLTKLMGSRAFSAVARAVLGCAELPEDENNPATNRQFVFGQEKNNLGRRVETGIRYEIEDALAGKARDGREVWTSKIKIVDYQDEMTVSEATVRAEEPKRSTRKTDDAQSALRAHLAAQPGRRALKREAIAAVMASGYGGSMSTLEKAAVAIGVVPEGSTRATYWVLPGGQGDSSVNYSEQSDGHSQVILVKQDDQNRRSPPGETTYMRERVDRISHIKPESPREVARVDRRTGEIL